VLRPEVLRELTMPPPEITPLSGPVVAAHPNLAEMPPGGA